MATFYAHYRSSAKGRWQRRDCPFKSPTTAIAHAKVILRQTSAAGRETRVVQVEALPWELTLARVKKLEVEVWSSKRNT
jgi:hypothetical protein